MTSSLCLTVERQFASHCEGVPGASPQQPSCPAESRSEARGRHDSQAGPEHGPGGPAEGGRSHGGQHGRRHSQGEQDGHRCVDGHDLAEFGERHNDTEKKGDC